MKLTISNIAWLPSENEEIARLLQEAGIRFIEVAPTTIANDPTAISSSQLRNFRRFWRDRDITIVAMQALLYGRADLRVFSDEVTRNRTIAYLEVIMNLACELGAEILVFGSPRNRKIADLDPETVREIEQEFFGRIGSIANRLNLEFCIEPNPPVYECDYLNTSDDVLDLLSRVASPGLRLHLDSAGMVLAGEGPERVRRLDAASLSHFHISEPDLAPIGRGGVPHADFASALGSIGYDRHVSIEMRPLHDRPGENIRRVASSVRKAAGMYGTGSR